MTTPKLHPAAVRASLEWDTANSLAELIHDAINDHLKDEEDRRFGQPHYGHPTFDDHLKSEGWVELREAAEELYDECMGSIHEPLGRALRRVRGEKP